MTISQLHRRMGHISPTAATRMIQHNLVEGIDLDTKTPIETCEACINAKIVRQSIPKERQSQCSAEPGARIHSDVWGPVQTETIGGKHYYITFTDDYSCETRTYLLHNKGKAFKKYQEYEAYLKAQWNVQIKRLQTDQGGEYLSTNFVQHLAKHGTKHQLTVHDTPKENGVAEQLNHTPVDNVC